jgi:hypothetical protein
MEESLLLISVEGSNPSGFNFHGNISFFPYQIVLIFHTNLGVTVLHPQYIDANHDYSFPPSQYLMERADLGAWANRGAGKTALSINEIENRLMIILVQPTYRRGH